MWTWIFIVWLLLVIARAFSEGAGNLAHDRSMAGTVQLVVGAFLAWGILLLFQRRPIARVYWLVVLAAFSAACAWLATVVTAERDLILATVLWLAAWALYFARSQRLRAVLQQVGEYEAPAV